jgi:hypothetical protein
MSGLQPFKVNLNFYGTAELMAESKEEAEDIALFLVMAVCGTVQNHDGAVLMHEQMPNMEYQQAKHYDEVKLGGIWHVPDKGVECVNQRKFQRPFLDGQELDQVGYPHDDDDETESPGT